MMNKKLLYLITTGLMVVVFVLGLNMEAVASNSRPVSVFAMVEDSKVIRLDDKEMNVVCYVIPESHCIGDCAYSPAISCVRKEK